jgi:hypothetical protein
MDRRDDGIILLVVDHALDHRLLDTEQPGPYLLAEHVVPPLVPAVGQQERRGQERRAPPRGRSDDPRIGQGSLKTPGHGVDTYADRRNTEAIGWSKRTLS